MLSCEAAATVVCVALSSLGESLWTTIWPKWALKGCERTHTLIHLW